VWCIFEAYSCEATRSNFGVAMTESESNTLVSKIGGDPEALLRNWMSTLTSLAVACASHTCKSLFACAEGVKSCRV
jgi:adenosine/AMP kinase